MCQHRHIMVLRPSSCSLTLCDRVHDPMTIYEHHLKHDHQHWSPNQGPLSPSQVGNECLDTLSCPSLGISFTSCLMNHRLTTIVNHRSHISPLSSPELFIEPLVGF